MRLFAPEKVKMSWMRKSLNENESVCSVEIESDARTLLFSAETLN